MHQSYAPMLCTPILCTDVEMKPGENSENSEKLKIAFWVEGSFGDHLSLLVIFDGSHYQKLQKMAITKHIVNIETCNKN